MRLIKMGLGAPNIFCINGEYIFAKTIKDAEEQYTKIHPSVFISSIDPVIELNNHVTNTYIIIDDIAGEVNYNLYYINVPIVEENKMGTCNFYNKRIYYICKLKSYENISSSFEKSIDRLKSKLDSLNDLEISFMSIKYINTVKCTNDNELVDIESVMIKQ